MRIGAMIGASTRHLSLDEALAEAADLESRGFDTAWVPHVFGLDAITTAALIGRETERIEVGTAVVPSHPRHPAALAQQALTAAVACRGRFTLGVGLSHPVVIESMMGLSYARKASHMREYMAVLGPLLRGAPAHVDGEEYRVNLALDVRDAPAVPVVIGALGPRMLEIAGREATGTITWSTGPRALEAHIVPRIREAARRAGRGEPRIVAGVHIVLTSDLERAREKIGRIVAMYGQMPSYKAMLEREGEAPLEEITIFGDEQALDTGLDRLRDVGVTDLEASVVALDPEANARTLDYLQSRRAASG